jgi:hypothetical protein
MIFEKPQTNRLMLSDLQLPAAWQAKPSNHTLASAI